MHFATTHGLSPELQPVFFERDSEQEDDENTISPALFKALCNRCVSDGAPFTLVKLIKKIIKTKTALKIIL